MKRTYWIFWIFFGIMGNSLHAQVAKIDLEWELLTNLPKSTFKSEAEFRIKNLSENLTDKNWSIFFNMAPIAVSELDTNSRLIVEHMNGDWYRLRPKKGFVLNPGELISLKYGNNKPITKEVLAPIGVYFVRYDENGKEIAVEKLHKYHLVPFTRDEQKVRGTAEGYGPFNAERVFHENEGLTDIVSESLPPIIPSPFRMENTKDKARFIKLAITSSSNLAFEQKYLMEKSAELLLNKGINGKGKGMIIPVHLAVDKLNNYQNAEAYTLEINKDKINIRGYDEAGVFYAVQSLLSLISSAKIISDHIELSTLRIQDKPRFPFRGLHFDVARNFKTKETVLRTLDILSHYKINNFLFYISEDEGWRVEIPGLPELTEIGSKRLHPKNGKESEGILPAYGSGPFVDYENGGSGFYTRAEFIEILKYAKERHINVIPELNFPGHARAAMVAMENRYEKFMEKGEKDKAEEYRLANPNDKSQYLSPQYFKDNVVDISKESVYRFYEKIIDEFTDMYAEAGLKLEKIHAGGDEVAKQAWSSSQEVGQWAKERNVKHDFLSLQAAFFKELMYRMEKKGLEVHGWEEIVINHDDGKYSPNPDFVGKKVIPHIWNNEYSYPDMGYKLANLGYEVILCNVTNLYLDLAYNNDPEDPGLLWAGFVDTKKTFSFAPYHFQNSTLINRFGKDVFHDQSPTFVKLNEDAKKNIRGVQAQMWAETINSRERVESYLLPKVIGFAEMAWTKERKWESEANRELRTKAMDKDWNEFANRIGKFEYPKLNIWNKGYNYWIPPVGITQKDGAIHANVAFPGLEIRYSSDGSEVTKNSPKYKSPIEPKENLKFKAFIN